MQWKDSISEGLKSRSETEERVVHPEVPNHNNLEEHPGLHTPPNNKQNNAALRNQDFLWTSLLNFTTK
jgi:hypothetical protein